MKIYFIDESWNSGDIIMKENDKNFNNQPLFGLCAIGIDENKLVLIENKIKELKRKYKIQSPELKIKSIYKYKKIAFLIELFEFLKNKNVDFFIEVIDKKYQIAINIVNHLIYPPYYTSYNPEIQMMKNIIATHIYHHISDNFFIEFSNISRKPSEKKLFDLWKNLKKELEKLNDELSKPIIKHLEESIDDFHLMKQNENKYNRPMYTYFLPLPDKNKRGENLVMLPYVNCFTNILARINQKENLSSIKLYFDEQAHFDEILEQYKLLLESNETFLPEMNINPFSNFYFDSKIPDLNFKNSKECIGIQIADLFAGFVCRSIWNIYQNKSYEEELLLLLLLQQMYSINLVAPINLQQKIFTSIELINLIKERQKSKDNQ